MGLLNASYVISIAFSVTLPFTASYFYPSFKTEYERRMKTTEFKVTSAPPLLLLAYKLKRTKLTLTEDQTTASVMDYHHAHSQIDVIHGLAAGKGVSSGFNKKMERKDE